ncbi:MAG: hypothetical protein JST13_13530, partial [Bacteroidetes bacterium]|nr:hypothetical protein [Bacteroidota bacterium]
MLPHLPLINKVSKCIFFTLIAFSCSGFIAATAQTNKIEILKTVFRKATAPAQKTDAALAICEQSHSLSTDTLYYYAQVAKKNAKAISDRQKEILSNCFIEDYLARKNLFDSAIRLCDADLKNISYANNRLAYTKTMMQKCHCLERANRNRAALDLAYQFLGEAEKFNDTIPQFFLKTLIGVVYRNMQQTELAMRWFLKADSVTESQKYEEIKNQFGIFFLIGMMYNWIFDGETNANKRLSDSLLSISYLDRAIADSRRFENLQILAKALNVKAAAIGNKEHAKIEGEYILEAQHIYNILQDTISMLNTISPMCFYYIDEGHPEKGVKACLDGIAIASRTNSYPILDLYSALGQ